MSYSPSVIERLQLDMGAVLQACPDLANVSVNILRPRANLSATMIQTAIDRALQGIAATNGLAGATILVEMPEGEVPYPEAPGPDLRMVCKVQVIENPLINMGANGTGISAEDLMLFVLNLFQGRYWQDYAATMTADKEASRPLPHLLEKNYVGYQCRFIIRMGLQGRVKTPLPLITGDSTVGVRVVGVGSIYYTTDGTYPTPTNGTLFAQNAIGEESGGVLVTEAGVPITTDQTFFPAAGTLVRAVAYQPNQQASDLAAKIIS